MDSVYMAQKKKATKQNKKPTKQKQKQRQYQRQSVVVNVNTATKKRTRSSAGKKSSSPLIQSIPLQYTPQLMLDQSSLLTEDGKNRIFQSEIRNGISLLNKETEKKTENMVKSLFELNEKKRDAWMRQQKTMDEENRKMAGEDNMEEEKRLEEIKKKQEKKEREREKRLIRDMRRRAKINIETDTETEVMARTTASQYPNQTEVERQIREQNPLPTPVDDSINMNNPMTPVQPDNVEEAVVAETPKRATVRRTNLDEEFTEQPNGRWICNTCNPVVSIAKTSRASHVKTPMHQNGGRQPAFRSP